MPTLAQLGITAITNASIPSGPAQIINHAQKIADEIGKTVANAAALPASGNWTNRTIMTSDTKSIYVWTGAGWVRTVDDTGWITPGLSTGWTNVASNPIQFRRRNGIVSMRGRASTTGTRNDAFAFPAGFLPDMPAGEFLVFICDATGPVRVHITSAGVFTMLTTGALANVCPANVRFDAL